MFSIAGAEVRNLMELKVGANSLSATFRADSLVRKVWRGNVEAERL